MSRTLRIARGVGGIIVCVTFLFGLFAGCATRPDGQASYQKDGVQYGVTKGAFRGRWWNYYERGCSYLDGGFAAEAERDLRTALAARKRDQLWPRTYGLHFLPEYFPHRELGVALLLQGNAEDAVTELETSIDQRYSARGAFYLEKARTALLDKAAPDSVAPTVEFLSPEPGKTLSGDTAEVTAVIRDDQYVTQVKVNGKRAEVRLSAKEVTIHHKIPLTPGLTEILIDATDLRGNTAQARLPITVDLDGPSVGFHTPVAVPGTVEGTVFDPAGVEGLTVGGIPATLDTGAGDEIRFSVELPADKASPPVRFTATDKLGNTTQGTLPVAIAKLSQAPPDIVPAVAGAGPEVISLASGVEGVFLGGRLVALVHAASPEGLRVHFENLHDGQRYLMSDIVVSLEAESDQPLVGLSLDGVPLTIPSGQTTARLSRRVSLKTGENTFVARVQDAAGRVKEQRVTIERAPSEIEDIKRRMAVAFLGSMPNGATPLQQEDAQFILEHLPQLLDKQERFTIVDRSLLPAVLAEQQLSAALASQRGRIELGKLIPAETMFSALVRRDTQSVELILEGVSTETGVRVAPRIEVAGPSDQMDALLEDLAIRTVQEFPRLQAKVLAVKDPEVTFAFTETDRVRPSTRCVLFEYGDPILDPVTGELLGKHTQILGEALIQAVGQASSSGSLVAPHHSGQAEEAGLADTKGDLYVVTK